MKMEFENKILQGHVMDVLKNIPDESVNCIVTSPPYWSLRKYGTDPVIFDGRDDCEHEWQSEKVTLQHENRNNIVGTQEEAVGQTGTAHIKKYDYTTIQFCSKCLAWKGELGLEPDFNMYVDHLCDIFDDVKRVLRKDGVLFVNLGDTYASSGGPSRHLGYNDPKYPNGRAGNFAEPAAYPQPNVQPKSLCLIPYRFAIEMQNRGWIVRNVLIWKKNNCLPSSATDRFTVDFEPVFMFTKNQDYYFETQYEPHTTQENRPDGIIRERTFGYDTEYPEVRSRGKQGWSNAMVGQPQQDNSGGFGFSPMGRIKRSVWEINTKPLMIDGEYAPHYASFPEALVEPMINAGVPEFICAKCNKPREKIYKVVGKQVTEAMKVAGCDAEGNYAGTEQKDYTETLAQEPSETKKRILESMSQVKEFTLSDCGCGAGWKSGIVLDPFFGSGTVGVVARKLGRDFIGIELSKEYVALAEKRLAPLMAQKRLDEVC